MSSKSPKEDSPKNVPFGGGLMRSMNQFFHEQPVRGVLQSIDDFFSKSFPGTSFPVNVTENDTEYQIKAQLPGVNREQIQISILENSVTITVENLEIVTEEDSKNDTFIKKQSQSRSSRTVRLPHLIHPRKVKASYKNGLLVIKVAKIKGREVPIE